MAAKRPSATKSAGKRSRKLDTYEAKRDFTATPEPAPAGAGSEGKPRFVIHEHSARRLHWDFRLEHEGVLASWALPKGLPEAPKENHLAVHTEDHPLEYLEFAGEIPKGEYGAGTIEIWDRGTFDVLKWEPRKVEVALHGERVQARYALFPIDKGGAPKNWLIHRMDPPADPDREPMPDRVVPMLARLGELPAGEDERWAYEVKWDGVRAIAYSRPGELRLESRNLIDITDRYPELGRLGRALGSHSAVLDGEVVAFDAQGRPSFSVLQQHRMQIHSAAQARRAAAHTPITYMIFDLLWLDGHSLMALPYGERRERLFGLGLKGERWQTPEHIVGHGRELLEASAEQGLEGVVAKRLDSSYEPGVRNRSWIKVKRVGRQELVIGGWLPGKGRRGKGLGALLLGVHDPGGALRYVGRVGTGFSERELDRLGRLLAPLQRSSSPFQAGPRPPRETVFVEPRLVAEVRFAEWTPGGQLRQPSYLGLRQDKDAAEVVAEVAQPGSDDEMATRAPEIPPRLEIEQRGAKSAYATVDGRELKLSNLDKVLYPKAGVTKRQVIDYFAEIGATILPHLRGRALTIRRWPDGVEADSFFQKQAPPHRPEWVRTVPLPAGRKTIDYLLVEDMATLVWLANLAAIELHTPLARAEAVQRPTSMVFDLDPGEPADVIDCAHVALQLQALFDDLGLASFVKTSGSKGLQVYVPLNVEDVSFEQTKPFAKAVAELFEQSEPERIISRMTKARRKGKVLIDWSQNDANKTTVCVYSLRAGPRPTVSAPLEWDEVRRALDRGDPELLTFEAPQVLERVGERGDVFAQLLSLKQRLPNFDVAPAAAAARSGRTADRRRPKRRTQGSRKSGV